MFQAALLQQQQLAQQRLQQARALQQQQQQRAAAAAAAAAAASSAASGSPGIGGGLGNLGIGNQTLIAGESVYSICRVASERVKGVGSKI